MQTTQILQTRTLTPPSLSHLCAKYLQIRFRIELNKCSCLPTRGPEAPPAPPLLLPVALASELDRIAVMLASAFLNRGK